MPDTVLDKAVSDAVEAEEVEIQEEPAKQEPVVDLKDKNARLLYDSLENPETNKEVVKLLAERVGLKIEAGETPKAATKSILERLREGVAPEYHFLVDNLAPALQSVIKSEIEAGLGPVRQQFTDRQVAEAERETTDAYNQMVTEHSDFKELEPEIAKISKRILLAPGAKVKEYMEDLYHIASKNKTANKAAAQTVSRITRNAKEALPASAEVAPKSVKVGSKLPSLREAIEAATRGEKFER